MKLVNVCTPYVQCNITSGNNTITISGTTYTISPGLYSNSILYSFLNAALSGITTTFRINFSGSASFTLSFSC